MRVEWKILKSVALGGLASVALAATASGETKSEAKFSESQRVGYLGETSKSAIARNVLSRLKNKTSAPKLKDSGERLVFWHEVALDSVALDHTPDPDTGLVDFVQGGPTRTSRAMAITMIAVYDAVNAFKRRYEPYNDIGRARPSASLDAAMAFAAYTVLCELYPDQKDRLDAILASDLAQMKASPKRIARGRAVGEAAAAAMMNRRANDHSGDPEPDFGEGGRVADGATNYFGNAVNGGTLAVGEWQPDPNTPPFSGDFNLSLGAYWGGVTPFVLDRGDEFRLPPPPAPGTPAYKGAFDEVASLGGSPENVNTPSTSTPETRFVGNFWGYDAVPLLGTPPRAYNQIAIQVALDQGMWKVEDLARYLAMVNAALADSGIAAWDSKWYYNWWRPVTGIRRDDGVPDTDNDSTWDPVGVSVVNTSVFIRPTPPFPSYPSGHATFAASLFEILREFFGDDTPFTHISDEYNGEGVDPFDPSVPRPLVPVRYESFTAAQRENGLSRIYNGVHWQYDNLQGQALGQSIARQLLDESEEFKRVRGRRR